MQIAICIRDSYTARREMVKSLLKIDALNPEMRTESCWKPDKRYASLLAEDLRPSRNNLKIFTALLDATNDPKEIEKLNNEEIELFVERSWFN